MCFFGVRCVFGSGFCLLKIGDGPDGRRKKGEDSPQSHSTR